MEDVYQKLLDLQSHGVRLGLERVRGALERLGSPHEGRRWVVVAGTNGKGSTSAFLAAMLRAGGYRVGLYTSPHLTDPRERIRVNGVAIAPEDFARQGERVLSAVDDAAPEETLTFFEALTCMALCHFAEEDVDLGILEVGLGGRLDAVNVVHPTVTVLTTTALDHREYLGDTVTDIAREKAGVLRPRTPLAAAVSDEVFREVVGPHCLREHIPVIKLGRDAVYSWSVGLFSYRGPRFRLRDISLGLPGSYQAENAALALAAAEHLTTRGFRIEPEQVRRGLSTAHWRGRFEVLSQQPPLVVDVAHNPNGAAALARSLQERYGDRRFDVFLAVRPDKDLAGILRALAPLTERLVLAGGPGDDLASAADLVEHVRDIIPDVRAVEQLHDVVDEVRASHASGRATLVTGSHRLVGVILQALSH